MSPTCPRACSRLVSAAVFMSIGVVQFLAGMVLLRSEFANLLAGPDFWTSVCNIAVGCLLGISAGVWKQRRKWKSKKHVVRRYLLLALLFSALTINATTLIILLLGEGNIHLSIPLENDGDHGKMTFASHVTAYAYSASVCCPVICIVVSIVDMCGSCFASANKKSAARKIYLNSLKRDRLRSPQWIYTKEQDLSKNKCQEPVLSSSESSSDDDSDAHIPPKYENTISDLQYVLGRMAEGRRDSILKDSTIMLRQLDLRRKNKCDALNSVGSNTKPVLLRVKESGASERLKNSSFIDNSRYSDDSEIRNNKPCSSDGKKSLVSSIDTSTKRLCPSRNKRPDTQQRYAQAEFIEHHNHSQSFAEKCRNFKEKRLPRPKIAENALGYSSDTNGHNSQINTVAVHKKSKMIIDSRARDLGEKSFLKNSSHENKRNESFEDYHEEFDENIKLFREKNNQKETQQVLDECFSPDGSDFSPDALELSRKNSSWAGEIVPINVRSSSLPRPSLKLIPVITPTVPTVQPERDRPKISDDSGISSIQSNSFCSETANRNEFKDRENNLSTFRENSKVENKENMLEYPVTSSQSVRKYDLSKVATMASISEEPNAGLKSLEQKAHCSSFYGSSPKKWDGHCRQQSLPLVFTGSSEEAQSDEKSSEINDTPRRKNSASGKTLRKLWSLAAPENHTDFLDQVVDDDSLIGLNEEELVARQLRNRAIRKVVQQRLKEEKIRMKKRNKEFI